MGSASPGFVGSSVPLATVGNHMGLIRTYDDMRKVWPAMRKYTEPKFTALGAHILFHWNWPSQQVFGTSKDEPIHTLADFAGRKIRVVAPQETEMLVRLNAAAVNLTTPEVPMALERGVADGLLSASFNVAGSKWYDFLKWVYVANLHLAGPNYELVNADAYNKLAPDIKATLDQVADEWSDKMNHDISAQDGSDLKMMVEEHGMQMVDAKPSDIEDLSIRMQDYWDSWVATQGPDGVEMMKEIRATLLR